MSRPMINEVYELNLFCSQFEQNNVSAAQEKQRHLDIISKLESGQAVLDVQKATNAVMNAEDQARYVCPKTFERAHSIIVSVSFF